MWADSCYRKGLDFDPDGDWHKDITPAYPPVVSSVRRRCVTLHGFGKKFLLSGEHFGPRVLA